MHRRSTSAILGRKLGRRPGSAACPRARLSLRSTRRKQTPFSASQLKPPDHDLRPSYLQHVDGRAPALHRKLRRPLNRNVESCLAHGPMDVRRVLLKVTIPIAWAADHAGVGDEPVIQNQLFQL